MDADGDIYGDEDYYDEEDDYGDEDYDDEQIQDALKQNPSAAFLYLS